MTPLYLCWERNSFKHNFFCGYSISISLLKTFVNKFCFVKSTRLGVTHFFPSQANPWLPIKHHHFRHTAEVPSFQSVFPSFNKTPFWIKPTQLRNGHSNRPWPRHGYLNRFTPCRGYALYPQDLIHLSWSDMDRHTIICEARIINQSLSLVHPSTGYLPMSLSSPAPCEPTIPYSQPIPAPQLHVRTLNVIVRLQVNAVYCLSGTATWLRGTLTLI